MTTLYPQQKQLVDAVYQAWTNGAQRVMMQSSTGTGKTEMMGEIAVNHLTQPWDSRYPGGVSIAHRNQLVGQISMTLAKRGIVHDIIAPDKVIKLIVNKHVRKYGRTFYDKRAKWKVAGVDSMKSMSPDLVAWCSSVGLVQTDEAHHVLRKNKWGKAVLLFPHARALLPTATPIRADGNGLGSHSTGLADALVEGPPMRWSIDSGFLTDYKYFGVNPSDLKLDDVKISTATGDFNPEELREAVKQSTAIVGDIVGTYIRYAMGKLGVTFAVDIEHGQTITDAFNAAGVRAVLLTADSSEEQRDKAIQAFERREILQLVNVDLFGEGFDLPAIECVSFGRPTASFSLYSQQWGRALRLLLDPALQSMWGSLTDAQRVHYIAVSEKPFAFIFDHVANLIRHNGPADKPVVWSLDGRSRGADDGIPLTTCEVCFKHFERIYSSCPHCGVKQSPPKPREGGLMGANVLDGDITQYDPAMLAKMRGEIARIDRAAYVPPGVPAAVVYRNHSARQAAQHHLRNTINLWAGSYGGSPDAVNYRRFYLTFHIDVLAACALTTSDAEALMEKINIDLNKRGIVNNVLN